MNIQDLENKKVKISSRSLTCKDENGKTCGVVTQAIQFINAPARDQVDYTKAVRACGIWGNKYREIVQNVVICNKKLYYLNDLSNKAFLEEHTKDHPERLEIFADIVEKVKEFDAIAEKAAEYMVVIPCYIVK